MVYVGLYRKFYIIVISCENYTRAFKDGDIYFFFFFLSTFCLHLYTFTISNLDVALFKFGIKEDFTNSLRSTGATYIQLWKNTDDFFKVFWRGEGVSQLDYDTEPMT